MKRSLLIIVFSFAVFIGVEVFSEATNGSEYNREDWFITSLEWQPYSGPRLENQGSSIDKLQVLLDKINVNLIVEYYPWLRSQFISKAKSSYLGYYPAWPYEVKEGFIASDPIDSSTLSVIINNDEIMENSDLEYLLSKYKLGLINTYIYPPSLYDILNGNPENVDWSKNELSLARKLNAGRVDFIITDPRAFLYIADLNNINNYRIDREIYQINLVLAVSDTPRNRLRLKLINQLIKNSKD